MKQRKRTTKEEKFNLTVLALQAYLKEEGRHCGFISWKKISVVQNKPDNDEIANATVKGIAIMEDYKKDGIRIEIPVNFTYAHNRNMSFGFRTEG